jgi:hypothetical protein
MDPYIEEYGLWEDFHNHLIVAISKRLADAVPEHYFVSTGERSYVVLVEPEGKKEHPFVSDVGVSSARKGRKSSHEAGAAVVEPTAEDEPVTLRAFIDEEHREKFIEVYETVPEQRLVTCVEVLSPTKKRPNSPGWNLYERKRMSLLLGHVNLVEIDLLRGGKRMPMLDPWPGSAYVIMVARAMNAQLCKVWPTHYRRPLPTIPVPLARPDPDIPLSLQPIIDEIHQRFRYSKRIDYAKPLHPRLPARDADWLRQQLRAGEKPRGR